MSDQKNAIDVALAFAEEKYADNPAFTVLASLLRTARAKGLIASSVDQNALLGGYRAALEGKPGYSTPPFLDTSIFAPLFREVGAMMEVTALTMALVEVLKALGEDVEI